MPMLPSDFAFFVAIKSVCYEMIIMVGKRCFLRYEYNDSLYERCAHNVRFRKKSTFGAHRACSGCSDA